MPRVSARIRALPARLSARVLALALVLGAGCAHTPPIPGGRAWLAPLNLQVVGDVPWSPDDGVGQAVLVQFFATWCLPCLQQQPALAELQARYGDQGLRIVWVGMDLEGALVLEPFALEMAPSWPVLVASEQLVAGVTQYGRIRSLPTSVLLDRAGRPVDGWSGLASPDVIAPLVEKALGPPR